MGGMPGSPRQFDRAGTLGRAVIREPASASLGRLRGRMRSMEAEERSCRGFPAARRRTSARKQQGAATDSVTVRKAASLERAAAQGRKAGGTDGRTPGRSGSARVGGGCRAMARRAPDGRMRWAGTRGQAGRNQARTSGLRGRRCGRGSGAGGGQAAWGAARSAPCSRTGSAEFPLAVLVRQPGQPRVQTLRRPPAGVGTGAETVRDPGVGMQPGAASRTRRTSARPRPPSAPPEPESCACPQEAAGARPLKPFTCGPRRKPRPDHQPLGAKLRLARLVHGLSAMI